MLPFQLARVPQRFCGTQSRISSVKTARTLTVTIALFAYASAAVAADSISQLIRRDAPKGITTSFYICLDKAGSYSIALASCLSTEKSTQDARLNATYKALLGKLHGKAKEQLISAERAWLAFHTRNGDFEASLYGDESIANLQLTQNEIFRLCERANALDKYLVIASDQAGTT